MRRNRIVSEEDALDMIKDGMTISIGGHIVSAHPMVLIRGIIRRKIKNLTVITSAQGGPEIGLMIAAGCIKKVITPGVHAEDLAPIDPVFRFAAQKGEIEVWETDEGIHYCMLRAAAQRLPYLPWHGGVGTSIPEVNPHLKIIKDPFHGKPLIAVPAVKPDVAILHAAYADAYGNVQHLHGWGDRAHYRAADKTIVQVEKIVPNEEIRKEPAKTSMLGVDAIVRAPFGAHPMASPGFYLEDREFIKEYVSIATKAYKTGDKKLLGEYLEKYFYKPKDHIEYLEKVGIKRLLSLYEF